MLLALNLSDKNILTAEPMHVFLQTAGHGIYGAQTVLNLIRHRRAGNAVFTHILHQMIKGHVVRNIAAAVRIVNLVLFRNTRTDKGKLVRHLHIFLHIDRTAHHRRMHRHQAWNQLGKILFYVPNHRRTGLGNASHKIMLRYVFDISPCGDIRSKADTDDTVYTKLSKAS